MATTIESGGSAAIKWPSGETLAASMQAMASAAGAQLDPAEVMRLYSQAGAGQAGRGESATGARPGVPAIPTPSISIDDAAIMIGALQTKLMDLMSQQQIGEVKSNQIDMKQKNVEQMEKVQKWLSDLAEAANQKKSAGIWGWIKSIFSVVVSAVAAVLSVAASPFTGGASLVVAAIAIGGLIDSLASLTIQALEAAGVEVPDSVKNVLGSLFSIGGWISGIARLCGASDEVANWIKLGVDLAVGLVTGVAAWKAISRAGAKVAEAGHEIIEATTQAVKNTTKELGAKAAKLSDNTQRVIVGVDTTSNLASAGFGVAEGVATIKAANAQRSADNAMADKMEIMAQINRIRMMMEQNIDDLKKIADEMQSVFRIVNDLISGEAEMKSQINAQLGGGRGAVV